MSFMNDFPKKHYPEVASLYLLAFIFLAACKYHSAIIGSIAITDTYFDVCK